MSQPRRIALHFFDRGLAVEPHRKVIISRGRIGHHKNRRNNSHEETGQKNHDSNPAVKKVNNPNVSAALPANASIARLARANTTRAGRYRRRHHANVDASIRITTTGASSASSQFRPNQPIDSIPNTLLAAERPSAIINAPMMQKSLSS